MTPPRQEGAPTAGDPDHQVRWSEGARVSHTHHHKDLSCSSRAGAWSYIRRRDSSSCIVGCRRSSLANCLLCSMHAIVIFKNILCPTALFFLGFRAFFLDFFEIQRYFVDCRTKFYSNAVFSWKGGSFHCKILFFWYFSDFQRLVRVRSVSMTNTKPLRGVVCHYCHNLGHVLQNCRKLQNKNRRFQSVHHQKSLKSAFTSISTLVESSKTNICFISSSSTWVIDSRATSHRPPATGHRPHDR